MFSILPRRRQPRAALCMIFGFAGALLTACPAASGAGMRLVDFGKLGVDSQISVNGSAEVATQIVEDPRGKSLEVRCTPGANPAPGVVIRPGDVLNWNLSAYGEVEADVTNLSDTPLVINLRVDNPGDGKETKGNVDKVALPVGKSGTVRVYFGYTMGEKAYALEPAKISQVVIFTAKPAKGSATFRVTALRAAGKPGDRPAGGGTAETTAKPGADGAVVRFDGSLSAAQAEAHGMKFILPPASKPGPALITIEAGANQKPSVVFKVAAGTRLDLSGYDQVEFALKNTYALSVHVSCRVEYAPDADGKPVAAVAEATLEPGASKTVAVPLAPVNGGFASDKVTAFAIVADPDGQEKRLELAKITATSSNSQAASPSPTVSKNATTPSPTPTPKPKMPLPGSSASPTPAASPTKPAVASPSPTPSPSESPSPKKSGASSETQKV